MKFKVFCTDPEFGAMRKWMFENNIINAANYYVSTMPVTDSGPFPIGLIQINDEQDASLFMLRFGEYVQN